MSIELFVCGTDWHHECKHVPHTVGFFKTVEELKAAKPCWESCGIVRLKVDEMEWVADQDYSKVIIHEGGL